MPPRLVMIHTVPSLQPVFEKLVREAIPDVRTSHVVSEDLLADAIREGRLTDANRSRVAEAIRRAEGEGADAVLVTCSSIGPAVAKAAASAGVPVVRVDQAMAREAVAAGRSVGVLATLRSTLEPTAALLRETAGSTGRTVQVVEQLVEGAFEALRAGDTEGHDELVRSGYAAIRDRVDVVVLAQASMARALDALPESDRPVPVLTSPRGAVAQVAAALGARG